MALLVLPILLMYGDAMTENVTSKASTKTFILSKTFFGMKVSIKAFLKKYFSEVFRKIQNNSEIIF